MSTPVFAAMQLDDLEEIGRLEPICFASPWSVDTYLRELTANRFSHYWVVRPGQDRSETDLPPILAYGGCWVLSPEAHIMTLATHPEWRRCKLAEYLLLHMISEIYRLGGEEVSLEVRESNLPAQQLYYRLGFVEVGRRKRYYPPTGRLPGEDALILTLHHLTCSKVRDGLDKRQEDVAREVARRLAA